MGELLYQTVLAGVLLVAVVTDLRSCRIPNWLTVPAMTSGVMIHTFIDGWVGLIFSLGGLAAGLALFLVFFTSGGMGAGDVKLMAAVGSFLGISDVMSAALLTMLLGGLYAAMTMIARYGLRNSIDRVWILLTEWTLLEEQSKATSRSQYQLRYAMVIALGTMLSQMIVAG